MAQEELRKVINGRISGIQKRLNDCVGALEVLKMTVDELETAELEEVKPEVGPEGPEELEVPAGPEDVPPVEEPEPSPDDKATK